MCRKESVWMAFYDSWNGEIEKEMARAGKKLFLLIVDGFLHVTLDEKNEMNFLGLLSSTRQGKQL